MRKQGYSWQLSQGIRQSPLVENLSDQTKPRTYIGENSDKELEIKLLKPKRNTSFMGWGKEEKE